MSEGSQHGRSGKARTSEGETSLKLSLAQAAWCCSARQDSPHSPKLEVALSPPKGAPRPGLVLSGGGMSVIGHSSGIVYGVQVNQRGFHGIVNGAHGI